MEITKNIVWHNATITKDDRHRMNGTNLQFFGTPVFPVQANQLSPIK